MASPVQAYAHLGYPKCASTSVQWMLGHMKVSYLGKLSRQQATKAAAKNGRSGPYTRFATDDIGRSVRVEVPAAPETIYDRDGVASALGAAVADRKVQRRGKVYLSDEILSGIGLSLYRQHRVDIGTVARRLADGFGVDTTFVVVIRSQPAMLWSYYRQLLRAGYPLSFETFLLDQALVPTKVESGRESFGGIVPHLLYDKVQQVIEPHGTVHLVPFEAMTSGQAGFDTFLSAMDLPTGLELPHRNKPAEDLEGTITKNIEAGRGLARAVPVGLRSRDRRGLRAQGLTAPSMTGWADKISPELTALFAESNARLAASTGLDLRGYGYPMPD
jgi:hypothetical protein